jgi:hypothetical protein
MSRVVVAAPYPTMPGPESAATFALVRSLVADGDDVTVVSPQPSAAHHHADPGGPRGAARLARLVSGSDRLHLRLDAAALAAGVESPRLLPGRLALAGVVRRADHVEVRLDRVPGSVSRQWASLVLGPARRVLVADDAARDALVAAGVAATKVDVVPEPAFDAELATAAERRRSRNAASASSGATATASATELQELVRRRAAEDRAANRKATTLAEGAASLPLRHLVRMERAPVRSNKPGGAFLKRSISKLLGWQFDNVIASVNRLHQATIDAVEALEAQRSDESSATSASAAAAKDRSRA